MNAWSIFVVLLSLSLLTVAGCFGTDDPDDLDADVDGEGDEGEPDPADDDDDNETVAPRGLMLSDLKECDFLYPDGETSVSCERTFDPLTVIPDGPPGTITTLAEQQNPWVCVDQTIEANWGYSIHWDPDGDRYGMYYHFDDPGLPVSGVFYKEDETVGASFHNQGDSGFILLPEVGRTDDTQMVSNVTFAFYTHNYLTKTPELEGGQIKALWSYFRGTAYPLQVLEAGGETYYLHNVTAKDAGADRHTYHIQSPMLEGEDFDLTVQSFELKRLQIGWNPRPALCTIV